MGFERYPSIPAAIHGMGCQRDYRQPHFTAMLPAANRSRGFEPVHFRHLHVHENQIEGFFIEHIESLATVGYDMNIGIALKNCPPSEASPMMAADRAYSELVERSVRPTQSVLAACLPLLAKDARNGVPSFMVVLRKSRFF
jgi:hypothetical protein